MWCNHSGSELPRLYFNCKILNGDDTFWQHSLGQAIGCDLCMEPYVSLVATLPLTPSATLSGLPLPMEVMLQYAGVPRTMYVNVPA